MIRHGGTTAVAAALAAMGDGEAAALGELNGVDKGGISLPLIDVNSTVISHDGEVDVVVAAQPMDGDDEPDDAPAALAAAGGAGGGRGAGGVDRNAARASARLHAKALLQEQRCASAGDVGKP
jgi:hypothetical protein